MFKLVIFICNLPCAVRCDPVAIPLKRSIRQILCVSIAFLIVGTWRKVAAFDMEQVLAVAFLGNCGWLEKFAGIVEDQGTFYSQDQALDDLDALENA